MPATLEENRLVVIPGVSWDAYVQMDELLDDSPVRMKWCEELLEIMSPISRYHETIKTNIGCMIDTFCRRNRLYFEKSGSTTLRKENMRGGEPDESYIFTRGQEKTDLVIEAAITSGGIDDLDFYRPLEIPEVWIWQHARLSVHSFRDGAYVPVEASRFLPGLDLALIQRLAEDPSTSDMLAEFDRALDA